MDITANRSMQWTMFRGGELDMTAKESNPQGE